MATTTWQHINEKSPTSSSNSDSASNSTSSSSSVLSRENSDININRELLSPKMSSNGLPFINRHVSVASNSSSSPSPPTTKPTAAAAAATTAAPSPAPTPNSDTGAAASSYSQPICQNCSTSTTPLWRRDENGQVLCNACGLFLKLHGRPRPISLKTDIIKSRNRVKTTFTGMSVSKSASASPAFRASSPSHASAMVQQAGISGNTVTAGSGVENSTNGSGSHGKRKRNNTLGTGKFRSTAPTNSGQRTSSAPSPSNSTIMNGSKPDSSQQSYYYMRPPTTSTFTPSIKPEGSVNDPVYNGSTSAASPAISSPTSSANHHIPQRITSPLMLASISGLSSKLNGLAQAATTSGSSIPSTTTTLPSTSSLASSINEKPALAALSAVAQAASESSNISAAALSPMMNHQSSHLNHHPSPSLSALSSITAPSPILNPTTTVLDQLSAAAAASPYLSPHQPESDTRVPPIAVTPKMGPYSRPSPAYENSRMEKPPSPTVSTSSSLHVGNSHETTDVDSSESLQQLRTRVTELELVNDLFRSKINELEVSEAAARKCETAVRESESLMRKYVKSLEAKVRELQAQVEKNTDAKADGENGKLELLSLKSSSSSSAPDEPGFKDSLDTKKLRISEII